MENVGLILKRGGVGVLATDTLYGLVGRALDPQAVERVYRLKRRLPSKPLIILIHDYSELAQFGVELSKTVRQALEQYWPGPVSIVLPCPDDRLEYLHRGGATLAFRMPAKRSLRQLLRQTGPLVAPSANPQGQPPSRNIAEARAYFGDKVDFYRPGRTAAKPSTLLEVKEDSVTVLRR